MGEGPGPGGRAVRELAARGERVLAAAGPRVGRCVRVPFLVPAAALAAFLLRLPGLTAPLGADESGFLLVARTWSPEPDSVYGPLFVARPPLLLGLVRGMDALAGPHALRVLGAVGCAALVLLAAATARLIADDLTARWTALAVAAVCANPLIDVVAVKGELLALPLLMLGVWSALVAVRRQAPGWAICSGLAGGLAVGMKQNLAGSLVFAVTLIVATAVAHRSPGALRRAATLLVGVAAGALVPVVATVEWAVVGGVGLDTLWYTVVGFRADASAVLADDGGASAARAGSLARAALAVGLVPVIAGFLVHLRAEWREDAPLAAAVLAMLTLDLAGVVGGGQYWRDYLFPLLVPVALCAAVLARHRSARGLAMRGVVLGMVISSVVSLGWWAVENVATERPPADSTTTGAAIAGAAGPGDTLTVFGGQPNLQYASGLDPVYPYLWSLQMRVLDPDYRELEKLLRSDDAPEWLAQWVGFSAWGQDEAGERLRLAVESRYVLHGPACGEHRVWLRADVERPALTPDCTGGD